MGLFRKQTRVGQIYWRLITFKLKWFVNPKVNSQVLSNFLAFYNLASSRMFIYDTAKKQWRTAKEIHVKLGCLTNQIKNVFNSWLTFSVVCLQNLILQRSICNQSFLLVLYECLLCRFLQITVHWFVYFRFWSELKLAEPNRYNELKVITSVYFVEHYCKFSSIRTYMALNASEKPGKIHKKAIWFGFAQTETFKKV